MYFLKADQPRPKPKEKLYKGLFLGLLLIFLYLVFILLNLFLRYWQLTIVAMLYLFVCLARKLGTALMFPGESGYFRGQVEMAYSNELGRNVQQALVFIGKSCEELLNGQWPARGSYENALKNIELLRDTFSRFEQKGLLSERKRKILTICQKLLVDLKESEVGASLHGYFTGTGRYVPTKEYLCRIHHTVQHIKMDIYSFFPQNMGSTQAILHQCRYEKLFYVPFGLHTYDKFYEFQEHQFSTEDNHLIYMLVLEGFKNRRLQYSKRTVIMCNPNGAFMQLLAMECKYIDFYLYNGYHVCLWNYRGYGRSTGVPSLTNNYKDVVVLYDYLVERGLNPVIAHGYSIGGTAAIYLASGRPIEILIADRTFASLDLLGRYYGSLFFHIMKIIFREQRKDYSYIYMNQVRCRKVIISDPYDEVIKGIASLKNGIAGHLCSKLTVGSAIQNSDDISDVNPSNKDFLSNEDSNDSPKILGVLYKKVVYDRSRDQRQNILSDTFIDDYIYNTMPFLVRESGSSRSRSERTSYIHGNLSDITTYFKHYGSLRHRPATRVIEPASAFLCYQVASALSNLDSGGMQNPSNSLKYVKYLNEKTLRLEAYAYLNGLLAFGSYLPYHRKYMQSAEARQDTIIKIAQTVKQLESIEESCKSMEHCYAIACLKHQLCHIGFLLCDNLNHEAYDHVGMLLPTRAGHNGYLSLYEYSFLEEVIKNTSV